jgi:hypothetical protein
MPSNWNGLVWLLLLLLLMLGPLLLLQRALHREIQAIFLVLTRRVEIAVVLFSLLFFPGVVLHEGSHFLMARLLCVRTGRLSILPRPLDDGNVQLGYVETAKTDWLRDALIGMAPLLIGGVFVAYAGLQQLGLSPLWEQFSRAGTIALADAIQAIYSQPDFWLWFYLTFAVSSTMMPSASDRRAWLPVGLIVALLLIISLFAGAGPWLFARLAAPLDQALQVVAIIIGISVLVHLVLLPPAWGLRRLLSWATRVEVVS